MVGLHVFESDQTPASDRRSYRSQRAARWPDVADRQCLGQPAVVACMRLRASLGIEGGFTQAAGAVGSKVGRLLKRRRHDVRMLVGAGAAGGIAGAFGAPFAGALELMVGSYTVATLPPVVAAAVAGTLAAHTFVGHTYHVHLDKFNLAQQGHLNRCRSWHRMRSAFGRADARRDGDGTPVPPQRPASRTAPRLGSERCSGGNSRCCPPLSRIDKYVRFTSLQITVPNMRPTRP